MQLHPISYYARALRPDLADDAFAPARSRLWWLPLHLAIAVIAIAAIARGWVPWPVVPLLSLAIGVAFAGLTFLGHELLHGAVVRDARLRHLLGGVCFAPFMVSPRLWIAWHNRTHHGHAQEVGRDPDAFPTLDEYREQAAARIATDLFAIGARRWRGGLSLVLGFTVQAADMLCNARRRGFMRRGEHALALVEAALALGFWIAVAVAIGPLAMLFAYVLPLVLANVAVMAFILTNHGLSPRTAVNDPLINSLSVTAPRWIELLTLGFGLHVEHHLFPAMSSRAAPRVRELLRARWPERYQSMTLGAALLHLHRTARVYKDDTTLLDPRSGREYPTLTPRPGADLA